MFEKRPHLRDLGWTQSTIKGGQRSSSATSYLAPQFISRPNLHVVLRTRVTRLVKTSKPSSAGLPIFRTVEVAHNVTGATTPLIWSQHDILTIRRSTTAIHSN